jgi:spore coat protein U-like protein
MDLLGLSCGDLIGGWDSGDTLLTANFVVPSLCQLNSTSTVDFGNINDISTTKHDYTAQGAVNSTCNYGTPYSIYLGDGNNRISGGFRRMTNGNNEFIPYQLYKDSNYSTVWDTTGGVTNVGGSGGVSKTGSGSAQTTTVYGKIPQGTSIASTPGNYSDSVVVTVTY